jgi:hypothetical protein
VPVRSARLPQQSSNETSKNAVRPSQSPQTDWGHDDASVRQRAELGLDMGAAALVLDLGGFALSSVPELSKAAIVSAARVPGAVIRCVAQYGRRVTPRRSAGCPTVV